MDRKAPFGRNSYLLHGEATYYLLEQQFPYGPWNDQGEVPTELQVEDQEYHEHTEIPASFLH